jgi:hypothetical protein
MSYPTAAVGSRADRVFPTPDSSPACLPIVCNLTSVACGSAVAALLVTARPTVSSEKILHLMLPQNLQDAQTHKTKLQDAFQKVRQFNKNADKMHSSRSHNHEGR